MKVREVMTKTVASCHSETNLAAAGELMWESNCGVLPVVDERNKVIGVLTDRDACIALTTSDRRASSVKVGEIATARAFVCEPDDEVQSALRTMRREKIHRLPVVNKAGMLEGILSINDILLRIEKGTGRKRPDVSCDEIVAALQEICAGRRARKQNASIGEFRTGAASSLDGVFGIKDRE